MNVFLTGATGVVGTRALPDLVAAGHTVTAVARGDEKAVLVRRLGGTPIAVDLFDAAAVKEAVAGHDTVIHLATHIPPMAKASRRKAWAANDRLRAEAAAHLMEAANAVGVDRYIQESVCFPYLDGGDRWIDETQPVDHEPFAFRSAGLAEALTLDFAGLARVGVVLRFGWFYAPNDRSHTAAMSKFVRWHVSPFLGDRDAYCSFVHADDAGSAVVAALAADSGVYNVVDDEPLTRAEADAAVATRLGTKPPKRIPRWALSLNPAAKSLTKSLRVSHAKLTEATGWTPSHRSIRDSWPTGTEP